ncbi:MAG: ATP-dependent DNA helicase RecQ [Cytophagales bacterium]|nr:ATP-dependent DNA helicase RecQ [Cytophagales bacterium]
MKNYLKAINILQQYWGYSQFRPLQEDIVNHVIQGNDTFALLPTGGGKSICFQVPGIALGGLTLVVSPLIALMKDQAEQLIKRGIQAAYIDSGKSTQAMYTIYEQAIEGKIRFLYLSPERLQTADFKERLPHIKCTLLAIDEAHCISQWGHDFRPSYKNIPQIKPLMAKIPTIALTATATQEVKKDIVKYLELKNYRVFQKSFERSNLSYAALETEDKEKKLLHILRAVPGSAVVYVRNRKNTKQIADFLNNNKISADYYHAGLGYEERSQKQDKWIKNNFRAMVATNAFGMGIDKPDVRTVVHMELPENIEAYYQEAGRAGRDEAKAYAVALYQHADFDKIMTQALQKYPDRMILESVYNALASYFQMPVGSVDDSPKDFDFEHFCSTFNLTNLTTYQALRQLETAGLIALNENFYTSSRMYIPDNKTLYEAQVKNPLLDRIIKTLLRMYGGALYTDFVNINEKAIAARSGMVYEDCLHHIRQMHKAGIIVYDEKNEMPKLTFMTARAPANRLPINYAHYEERKKFAINKAQKIIAYMGSAHVCRTKQLLDYFGEIYDKDCGVCDHCVEKKKKMKLNNDLFIDKIIYILQQNPMYPNDLLTASGLKEDVFNNVVTILLDSNTISYQAGMLCINISTK